MEIKSYLDNLKVKYKVHKHLPVYTCEESDKLKVTINGMHAKSLLVKGKITKNFYMVIIPCNEKIDRKELKDKIMEEITFAIIRDKESKITLVFSKKVLGSEILNFHPNINTETIELKNSEFRKYVNSLKNKIIIL